MFWLYDNLATAALAVFVCAFAWLYGGTLPSELMPAMPWLGVIAIELSLSFPQRHAGESSSAARRRVLKELRRDRLLWVVLVFWALLAVPFFNQAHCPICDYPAINFDGVSENAPAPMLPFCVDWIEHFNVAFWFFSALGAMLLVRHALLKRGKRTLVAMVVWNGVALAAVGFLQYVTDAKAPLWGENAIDCYFFSTFGYVNMAGDYFTTLFCLAVACWRRRLDEVYAERAEADSSAEPNYRRFARRHIYLIPAVVCLFAAMMTLSRAAILLSAGAALLFFVHAFASLLKRMDRRRRVKAFVANIIALAIASTLFFVFLSASEHSDSFRREITSIDSGTDLIDRVAGAGQYHSRVAFEIWQDHPVFGCGGWGYKHYSMTKLTDAEFRSVQRVGGINVHNDLLQFMAEHGIAGLLAILLCMGMPLASTLRVWRALITSVRFMKPRERPSRPISVFALPAGAFCILTAITATFVHSFADCPLRSPAVLTLFFVLFVAIDGYLPELRHDD